MRGRHSRHPARRSRRIASSTPRATVDSVIGRVARKTRFTPSPNSSRSADALKHFLLAARRKRFAGVYIRRMCTGSEQRRQRQTSESASSAAVTVRIADGAMVMRERQTSERTKGRRQSLTQRSITEFFVATRGGRNRGGRHTEVTNTRWTPTRGWTWTRYR